MKEPRKTPHPPALSPLDEALEAAFDPMAEESSPASSAPSSMASLAQREAPEGQAALLMEETSDGESSPRARDAEDFEEQPETVADQIARLPKRWMQCYAGTLFKVGGIASLARKAIRPECGGISIDSVRKAAANCPEFAALIAAAQLDGQQTVDAAVYTGATVGDDVPVYQQGEYVATKKVRSDKAAELFYKKNGLMADQQVNVTHTGHVTTPDEALPAQLLRVAEMLFGGQEPTLDATTGKLVEW